MTPHAWDEYRDRRDRERAARTNAEQQRLARERAARLHRLIVLAFAAAGWGFIAMGVALYMFTAPPIGGFDWDVTTVLVSALLILGGVVTLVLKDWEA